MRSPEHGPGQVRCVPCKGPFHPAAGDYDRGHRAGHARGRSTPGCEGICAADGAGRLLRGGGDEHPGEVIVWRSEARRWTTIDRSKFCPVQLAAQLMSTSTFSGLGVSNAPSARRLSRSPSSASFLRTNSAPGTTSNFEVRSSPLLRCDCRRARVCTAPSRFPTATWCGRLRGGVPRGNGGGLGPLLRTRGRPASDRPGARVRGSFLAAADRAIAR